MGIFIWCLEKKGEALIILQKYCAKVLFYTRDLFAVYHTKRVKKNIFANIVVLLLFFMREVKLAQSIVHPGGWHNLNDLVRIRSKLAVNAEPWISAKNDLFNAAPYSNYKPNAVPFITRGQGITTGQANFANDAMHAYTLMVKWMATSDIAYADAAIRVIDSWSATLTTINGTEAILVAAIFGTKFAQAAELAAYAQPLWSNKTRAQTMFRNIFYPIVTVGNSNGFGTPAIAALTIFGVFLDDTDMLNEGIEAFKYGFTNPKGCAGVTQYIDESGENAESGRDQPHSQGSIGHLLAAAVVAWNQGVNLFTYGNNRLVTGFEYTAKYNLGYTVPYHPFKHHCNGHTYPNGISKANRARFSLIYEMTSYFDLVSQPAPYCKMVYLQYAPERTQQDHPGLGTLTFRRETIGVRSQFITFPNLPNKRVKDPDFDPGASVSSSLPVVYSSSNPTVATITDAGKIHLEGGGSVTIFAYQLGDVIYATAPIAFQTLMVTLDAYQRVEAANFNLQSGVETEITKDVDGDLNLSFIDAGDWTAYNAMDFGTTGTTILNVRYAIREAASTIQTRLGSPTGTLIGTCNLPSTGDFQTWKTNLCSISAMTGIHNVYFVYGKGLNLNWFRFDTITLENIIG
jgi:hypothetical protein